jgi:hypothetical protein
MLNKNLIAVLIVTILSVMNVSAKDALSVYESHKRIYSSKTLNPHYVGPVFATGGAMTEINRLIKNMDPEKIGEFSTNSLTLFETAPLKNQVFNFKKIKAYKVRKDGNEFTVLHMKGKIDSVKYEIVIEVREGSNYDRTITIYKNNVASILILWIDNIKIIQKKSDLEA